VEGEEGPLLAGGEVELDRAEGLLVEMLSKRADIVAVIHRIPSEAKQR